MAQQLHYYNRPLRDYLGWGRRPKGEIGIEVEVEGGPWPDAPPTNWEAHNDGSLRNGGIEYVIRQPVRRDKTRDALVVLKDALADARLDFSQRTSIHVHVNVQDMTIRQWCSYLAVCTVFEELLVDIVGPGRAGNRFCLRVKDADESIRSVIRGIRDQNLPMHIGGDLKYSAMNVLATASHGTLEFRAMEGNLDVDRIDDWVQMLGALRDYAMKLDNPQDIPAEFSAKGPLEWAREVLPEGNAMTAKVLAAPNLVESLFEGVRLAQDLCFCVPWDKDDPAAIGPVPNKKAVDFADEIEAVAVAAPPRRRVRMAPPPGVAPDVWENLMRPVQDNQIFIDDPRPIARDPFA